MTLVSNLTSLVVFIILGQVNIMIGLSMGICMMIGSFVGARTAIKFGIPFIKPLFITVVVLMAANLAWSAWV